VQYGRFTIKNRQYDEKLADVMSASYKKLSYEVQLQVCAVCVDVRRMRMLVRAGLSKQKYKTNSDTYDYAIYMCGM